jgi:alpha/beta superfamily hydrolase
MVLVYPSESVKKRTLPHEMRPMPEVIFAGPDGRLEGRYHPQKDRDAPIAIVLHPHPAYGGTMNNKVVYNLHYAFYNLGFTVLRFNFRGVGRSQGEYDQGIGELSDAASALDYLQAMNQNAKHCWVAGFLRRLDRHAASDAPARDHRLRLGRAAGEPL